MAAARVERRLAAVLAADVVGYSRLMEADEAGTFACLKVLRRELIEPVLREHGGRFVDLKGDGAIVEFASVTSAVEAAVAIQMAMRTREPGLPDDRRIRYRIGINLGDVIIDGETIQGDGINVAARIEALCEPGGVWLSRSVHNQVKGKLDLAFAATGRHQVKNISEPVETFRVAFDGAAPAARPAARANRRQRFVLTTAAFLFTVVFLGGVWWLWPADPASAAPSIAVLQFDNLGGDEATGRLAEGLTEDIITDLARYRDLAVIARNSTGVYRGTPVDIRQVGTDLDVGYVLEGSIQRQGEHVRVTAQLIDARTGAHAWSQRWDRPAADVFAVQTEIAERVASTLGGYGLLTSQSVAAAKRKRPADLEAYDLWALAYEALMRGQEADLDEALVHIDAAIAKDPGLVRAYTKKAWIRIMRAKFKNDWVEAVADMERLARTAIGIDPLDAEAHVVLAFANTWSGRFAEARSEVARALELNPSSAPPAWLSSVAPRKQPQR
jgi:TolB-like protein/class 3 adenylate cyclase